MLCVPISATLEFSLTAIPSTGSLGPHWPSLLAINLDQSPTIVGNPAEKLGFGTLTQLQALGARPLRSTVSMLPMIATGPEEYGFVKGSSIKPRKKNTEEVLEANLSFTKDFAEVRHAEPGPRLIQELLPDSLEFSNGRQDLPSFILFFKWSFEKGSAAPRSVVALAMRVSRREKTWLEFYTPWFELLWHEGWSIMLTEKKAVTVCRRKGADCDFHSIAIDDMPPALLPPKPVSEGGRTDGSTSLVGTSVLPPLPNLEPEEDLELATEEQAHSLPLTSFHMGSL